MRAWLLVPDRRTPVWVCVSTTLAPETTAPVGSVPEPDTGPRLVGAWATTARTAAAPSAHIRVCMASLQSLPAVRARQLRTASAILFGGSDAVSRRILSRMPEAYRTLPGKSFDYGKDLLRTVLDSS